MQRFGFTSGNYIHVFPKNKHANIRPDEELALKRLASYYLGLTASEMKRAVTQRELMEIDLNA